MCGINEFGVRSNKKKYIDIVKKIFDIGQEKCEKFEKLIRNALKKHSDEALDELILAEEKEKQQIKR